MLADKHTNSQTDKDTPTETHTQTYGNLIETAKLESGVSVYRWSDVLTVVGVFHNLQLPHAGHIGQSRLDLCHVRYLERDDKSCRSKPVLDYTMCSY